MTRPLDGIRVIDVATMVAGPATGALLADLGADVIKVEPIDGDRYRNALPTQGNKRNYGFDLVNRGKRCIAVEIRRPGGPELVARLAETADVFLTNMTPPQCTRFGLGYEDLRARKRDIIFASLTGFGTTGPDRDRKGTDVAAFWARSGIMARHGEPEDPPAICKGSFGDHVSAMNLCSAILAALLLRNATGEGSLVEVALQGTGMWAIGGDYGNTLNSGIDPGRPSRKHPVNPMYNQYLCRDGRWLVLVNYKAFPGKWPPFCDVIGRPEWKEQYTSIQQLVEHCEHLTAEIDRILVTRDRDDWGRAFDARDIVWAPAASIAETIADPQVEAMGWIREVQSYDGPVRTLDIPFRIHGSDIGARVGAPAIGQHTFEILAELGLGAEDVDALAVAGVLG